MTKLLIIGGSDAGISAALRAKEVDAQAEVSVIVADSFPNYSICGLPFYLSGEVPDWHACSCSPDGGRHSSCSGYICSSTRQPNALMRTHIRSR